MDLVNEILTLVNRGGVVVLLIAAVVALWKGWIVRASEYHEVVEQNKRLIADNEMLRQTLATVTQGLAHPVRQTLEAIPTTEAVS